MYRVYQTEGWILGSMEIGEANRFLDIFTADFGLVRGMAQGVRKIDSKLRYGLQDYSFGKVSLVRGKQFWRIVGAERLDHFDEIYKDKRKFRLVCRIFSLLKRLISGEEQDMAVFADINAAIKFLSQNEISNEALSALEIVLVFRILQKLGYVGDSGDLDELAAFSDWHPDRLVQDGDKRSRLLKQINYSLAHSHL